MPAVLSDKTLEMLEDLPPFEQGSKDIQAAVDVIARELDRVNAAMLNVRANFWPQLGADFLGIWEYILGLSVNPPDKTLDQRRTSVLAFLQKLKGSGSGLDWQANVDYLIGTGWAYEEHIPGDGASPAANVVKITLPFATTLPVPAGLAGVASAGGALAAGTYFYVVTATNFYGETTGSVALSKTVTAAQQVALSWTAVTGATGYRVYRGASSGAVFHIADVTTNAYNDAGGQTPTTSPPLTNTTRSAQAYEALSLLRQITPAHIDLDVGFGSGFILNTSHLGDTL